MSDQTAAHRTSNGKLLAWSVSLMLLAGVGLAWPDRAADAARFVMWGLIVVAPIVIPGIVLAAWIIASGADAHIAGAFEGRTLRTVLAASLFGAITPVCGVTVLPLMAGLLAAGVPLAPIMAFWLSSPVTDPAMLATTAATLGLSFAIGKTLAAFGLGLFGGAITGLFVKTPWAMNALRDNGLARQLSAARCGEDRPFDPWVLAVRSTTAVLQQAVLGDHAADPDLPDPGICRRVCLERRTDTRGTGSICWRRQMVGHTRRCLRRCSSLYRWLRRAPAYARVD